MKPIYVEPFLPDDRMDAIEEELLSLAWETKRTARHEYFMADEETNYSYGRQDDGINYTSKPWSPRVEELLAHPMLDVTMPVPAGTPVGFNGCFLNKYDDQHQHLGWHADDFVGMDPNAPIAVMSFGAEREIWVKRKFHPCPTCQDNGTVKDGMWLIVCPHCHGNFGMESVRGPVPPEDRYLLERGSIFIMPPGFQQEMLHRIPKHSQPCGWRISLTFRKFFTAVA